jgi:transposase
MKRAEPRIIEWNVKDLEAVIRRIEAGRPTPEDYETLRTLSQSYIHLVAMLKDKNVSIGRLRRILFGATTEKTDAVLGDATESSSGSSTDDDASEEDAPSEDAKPPPKGHGRNGADAYPGAEKFHVPHKSLRSGDPCPECGEGVVYERSKPGVLIRLVGQAPVQAKVYRLQKLRCNLCDKLFTASPPDGAGDKKYDATVAAMIGLLKYGGGLPFNRLEGLQGSLGIPLPASTQWDLVNDAARLIKPAFLELVRQAAQGDVVHNDDTTVRILERMGKRKDRRAALESADEKRPERRGLFTTCVLSTTHAGCRIAVFFSGLKHAGENLNSLLSRRAESLVTPIQMCDALSRNTPKEFKTIMANCLAHGRRQFVDVAEQFPEPCRRVLEAFKTIYHNDAIAKEHNLSPEARLAFHIKETSPVANDLKAWLERQFDERLVEPNSSLGGAINYLLRHWNELTLFLRQAGAPLDNNICERALKKAVLHRKNALFYKTDHGASVGDLYMSLIYSCQLCGSDPFDYLTTLQRNADSLIARPEDWMPWNYRAART